MSVMSNRPLARWLAPVGVAVAIFAGGGVVAALRGAATVTLPSASPSSLLADMATAQIDGASGTISERADLGLPDLSDVVAGEGKADFTSLISGSHTLRAWFDGPTKMRVALLGALSESDVIRNGSDVWIWSSRDNTARHATLPARPTGANTPAPAIPLPGSLPSGLPSALASRLPKTPQAAAAALVAAIGPSTSVTVGSAVRVAGRASYSLVVAPKASASLIGSIRIAIDGERHVPLRVQVFAKHYAKPAFEIGFTQIAFERPDRSVFAFNPPPGTTVTPLRPPPSGSPKTPTAAPTATPSGPTPPGSVPSHDATIPGQATVIGSGWTAVVVARLSGYDGAASGGTPPTPSGSAPATPPPAAPEANPSRPPNSDTLRSMVKSLPSIHGVFGNGRLLETRLVTALILDDGRVIFGAVEPSTLIAAASSPAAAMTAPAHK